MAKKLTPNQLKVLRDLAERYHNNDLQSRVLPVDKRTARGMTTLERPYIKPSFPIAKTYYYFITEAGLKHLAALDAQPAAGNAGSDTDLLDEDVYIDEPVNSKPIAVISLDSDVPVSPRLNNALNILTGENRQWVHVPLEKQHTGIYALLDEAGVRDGGLMSITDRVKALVQEKNRYEDALVKIRTWLRGEKGYSQEMVQIADEALNP